MDTNTQYKIVEGYKQAFEDQVNLLAKEGWIFCSGGLIIQETGKGFWYVQIMSRHVNRKSLA